MLRSCKAMVLVGCCFGVAMKLFASPDPACYRLNPECTRTERPGGAQCPAGEKTWLIKENAAAYCTGGLSDADRVVVRDYLLARDGLLDSLTVDDGIEVTFQSSPGKRQVGKPFLLTAQIKDKDGVSVTGKTVELLVLADGKVVSALRQWEGDDPDIRGVWEGLQVSFSDLFLTQDLPQGSQLVVVVRDELGGSKFYAQALPFSSSAAQYKLTEVAHEVVGNPPQLQWTLSFSTDIPSGTLVSYYVSSEWGDRSDVITHNLPRNRPAPSSLTIVGEPHRLWGEGCFTLVVGLFKPSFGAGGVMLVSYDIVTAPFGSSCN